MEAPEDVKNKLASAMNDLVIDDDDDGEAAVMEDSDPDLEEDEVCFALYLLSRKNDNIFNFAGRS